MDEPNKMDEIEVAIKSFGDGRKSTLLDEFERKSVEIQLKQAMLRRSLSEPGTWMLGVGGAPPPLVQQPVKQGKRVRSSWGGGGLHKMVKKLLRPVFWKKKSRRNDDQKQEQHELNSKDLKFCRRFSKSVRYQ